MFINIFLKDHLSYYRKINQVPTVEFGDNKKNLLLNQRFVFYFALKISENDFNNKTVLELCPGSGYNSYYLLEKCKIKSIELVDYSDDSIKKINKNLSKFKNVTIKKEKIQNYNTKNIYDFVIMENALDGFRDDELIFKKLCKFTKKGGSIIVTFGDIFGIFSTKIRFLYSKLILDQKNIKNFDKKLEFLSSLFLDHMSYLSKNTRSAEKWVLDNILNEEWIKRKNYFSYDKLNKLIKSNFLIKSNSPRFEKSFTWYKNKKLSLHNLEIFEEYKKNKINLLDFETKFQSTLNIIDEKLDKISDQVAVVDEKIDIIDNKLDEGFNDLAQLIKTSNPIQNPSTPKDYLLNAYLYKNGGDLKKSESSFLKFFELTQSYKIDVLADYLDVIGSLNGRLYVKTFFETSNSDDEVFKLFKTIYISENEDVMKNIKKLDVNKNLIDFGIVQASNNANFWNSLAFKGIETMNQTAIELNEYQTRLFDKGLADLGYLIINPLNVNRLLYNPVNPTTTFISFYYESSKISRKLPPLPKFKKKTL